MVSGRTISANKDREPEVRRALDPVRLHTLLNARAARNVRQRSHIAPEAMSDERALLSFAVEKRGLFMVLKYMIP